MCTWSAQSKWITTEKGCGRGVIKFAEEERRRGVAKREENKKNSGGVVARRARYSCPAGTALTETKKHSKMLPSGGISSSSGWTKKKDTGPSLHAQKEEGRVKVGTLE